MGLLPDAPLILGDGHLMEYYSVDASGYSVKPRGVALPRSVGDVADVVRWAAQNRTPVTARGAGTGLAGGALGDGIILDTSRMDRVRYLDGVVSAGPGARLGAVARLLSGYGRILGPNPSVGPYCSVGGMVATNASGSLSLGYGSIIDNLESVTLVDGRGDVVELPSNRHYSDIISGICRRAGPFPDTTKNSCGYRLDAVPSPDMSHRVVAASEGTLGVVVGARLRTHPAPRRRALAVMRYADARSAAADCPRILECGPVSLEVVGPGIMEGYGGSCVLFAEFHDSVPERGGPDHADRVCGDVRRAAGVRPVMIREGIDRWLAGRNAALSRSLGMTGDRAPSIIEDATVPLERLPDLFDVIRELGERTGSTPVYYGHAGSGNIHVRTPADSRVTEWYLCEVMALGGTITGEHGDGMGRTGFVRRQYGEQNHMLFGLLKDAFDPHHILNPGKILPA
ncbi:MAG: FAD-binding oxidoreductase [Thaumarchaeota archaeon]|nr:FAD-binding oxidoreductase [Nitrososphaerota archaeon]